MEKEKEQPEQQEQLEPQKQKEQQEQEDKQITHIKGVIESILFVNERPVTIDQLKSVLTTVSTGEIKKIVKALIHQHSQNDHGMVIKEIAGGIQMLSNPIYANYIREFYKTKHKEKLSKPALETLAIIAYKQPVTRGEIELIRSVNSDGVVTHLQNKELIKIVGRKDVPGKPFIYGTTKQFMEYFGLKSLDDLPKLEEFPQLQPEYEKESGDLLKEGEARIPEEAIAANSLENVKQSAIKQEVKSGNGTRSLENSEAGSQTMEAQESKEDQENKG